MPAPRAWSDTIDPSTIPDHVLYSEVGRRRGALSPREGRPRSKGKRCPCKIMTLKRAQTRGRSYEHDPSCSFYPLEPRALVV